MGKGKDGWVMNRWLASGASAMQLKKFKKIKNILKGKMLKAKISNYILFSFIAPFYFPLTMSKIAGYT